MAVDAIAQQTGKPLTVGLLEGRQQQSNPMD